MKQRPAACLALLVFLFLRLLPAGFFYETLPISAKCEAQVTGRVSRRTEKDDRMQVYLTDCQVQCGSEAFETGQILAYLPDSTSYPIGTDLSLSGTVYPLEEPTNPGQFDSRLYYQGKGIACTFFAERAEVLAVHPCHIREGLLVFREKVMNVYEHVFDEKDSGLLQAMVLGAKEGLEEETKQFYQRNGISHLLAISGLHISLVGMGFYQLLKRTTGSCVWAGIPSVLFLCAYGWMTGASVSAVRAAFMCTMAIAADAAGRTYDLLTAAGAAALLLMFINPLYAFQSAFLLSFGSVTAVGLLQPLWSLYKAKPGKIAQARFMSVSIQLLTFPLLLCFFYEYPLYSTFLNLLAIPLMSVLMVCGILCGLCGLVYFPAARFFAVPCRLILSVYEWSGSRCLALQGSVLMTGSPAGWKLFFYYGMFVTGLFLLYQERRRKKYWRGKEPFHPRRRVLAGVLGGMAACVFGLCIQVHTGIQITMLDVGQGDSVCLKSPGGITCLYDGGSSNVKKAGTYRILPFLKWSGNGTIDYILISHMDQDHINGLEELIADSMTPGGIRIGHAVLPRLACPDEAYEQMEARFRDAGIPVLRMGTGDRLSDGGFSLTCLWPEEEARSDDRNDLSMVLLAEYGEFQMLLTGDIGKETENRLAASGRLTDVEILKTAHHGSRHSSTEAFLNAVRPEVSLISCSAANRYGHPGEETLQRIREAGSRIYITKDCGAIRIWTDGKKVRVKSFRDL